MTLTLEEVTALAPDDASAKAARGLVAPAKWPLLGANDVAVWGECQGSGSRPYQTQVDLAGPAFRCSCPSRKFPCKHGLALLMLRAQDSARFTATEAPAWVGEWLASRGEKAQKKEERQAEKAAAPVDPQAAARREAQRWQRVAGAAQDLHRFLADQLAAGLGALDPAAVRLWATVAARMVDAQAPGLGARLQEAAAGVRQGEYWPEQTLHRLGLLQLACDGIARRQALPEGVQADLRTVAGWPHDQAEVAALGERSVDDWRVLGCVTEERTDKLTERRVWLHGARDGHRALLLDHAFAGRGFESAWSVGATVRATLAWFPGASPLRALALDRAPAAAAAPLHTDADEWGAIARRVAACPWTPLHPLHVRAARVHNTGDGAWLVQGGHAWPLILGEGPLWQLLACTGGGALDLFGEWDGARIRPLTAWQAGSARPVWTREAA
ncbi:MAG: SWIM zinc finger family protein [Betaproteobacteria bacterium]